MSYPKPWKSYDAQLDQLMARGMIVTDRARALAHLERIGYYRLSGYWFAFRERSAPVCRLDAQGRKPTKVREERIALDRFREGATFQNAVDLYVFDKQLRLLVLDALERIEIGLRVALISPSCHPLRNRAGSRRWKSMRMRAHAAFCS